MGGVSVETVLYRNTSVYGTVTIIIATVISIMINGHDNDRSIDTQNTCHMTCH